MMPFAAMKLRKVDGAAASTSSLLHFDGADGSTTFTDEVGNIWTPQGNAQIDTAFSQFGGASGLFDGAGDCLTCPISAGHQLGTGDWTIEAWIRPTANGDIFSTRNSSTGITLRLISSNQLDLFQGTGTDRIFAPSTIGLNAWHHVAATRQGSVTRIFVDGVIKNTGSTTANWNSSASVVSIGAWNNGGSPTSFFPGHIDELRLTKGAALYTANFTPAGPFTYP